MIEVRTVVLSVLVGRVLASCEPTPIAYQRRPVQPTVRANLREVAQQFVFEFCRSLPVREGRPVDALEYTTPTARCLRWGSRFRDAVVTVTPGGGVRSRDIQRFELSSAQGNVYSYMVQVSLDPASRSRSVISGQRVLEFCALHFRSSACVSVGGYLCESTVHPSSYAYRIDCPDNTQRLLEVVSLESMSEMHETECTGLRSP